MSVVCRGGFRIRPGAFAAARGPRDDASIVPYRVCGWPQGLRWVCLPCQREVARPEAVTEGLPYGGLALLSSGILRRGNPPISALAPFDKGACWKCAAG